MPHSRAEGKDWMVEKIVQAAPKTVLDVGAGAGTYWDLLHDKVQARWTGIEIFDPYVHRFNLRTKYDTLLVGDFLELDLQPHDVVILGDVLEHVEKTDGIRMWDKARSLGQVFLCLPIDHFEQGEVYGNVHETHRHHWTHQEVLSDLEGVTESLEGKRKGCYRA